MPAAALRLIHIDIVGLVLLSSLFLIKTAESMLRSPRTGRSMSPEAALQAQAEARRLAAFPSAKVPDADSEPAIDRYDWPAPPSPAVVMIDRRKSLLVAFAPLSEFAMLVGRIFRSN